ncbi:MAG: hypothetical protein GX163_07575 [Bacteroidetes bacterium]|nr:hypothetical protein [Bacteroidota bacterium]
MNLKSVLYLVLALVFSTTLSAQKYATSSMAEVKTSWKDGNFSSNTPLSENIATASNLSDYKQLFQNNPQAKRLENEEMVTVFIVSNEGFSDLSEKQKEAFFNDKNKVAKMVAFLSVPGRIDFHGLKVAAERNNGSARLKTLEGTDIIVSTQGDKVFLEDPNGKKSEITASDFYHKNGLFHIINRRLTPEVEK